MEVCWGGDLDVASAPVLSSALRVLADRGVLTVSLDLSEVAFMDCRGLAALIESDSRLAGGLVLVGPSRAVRWLLTLVGMTERFVGSRGPGSTSSVAETRVAIERAKGLVMASYGCTADQAANILLSSALQHNVQVQVLSALLVAVTSAGPNLADVDPAHAVQQVVGAADGPRRVADPASAPSAR